MIAESRPVEGHEATYAHELAMCERFVEQVEAAEHAYRQGAPSIAAGYLKLAHDLLTRHEAGEAV